jgi:regulator of RNase E activity RraB
MEDNISYMFYHAQDADRLRDGSAYVYLKYTILDKDMENVMKLIRKYDVEWNGDRTECMKLSFKE